MRIVAGRYGGRRLDVPSNNDIRPTSDKVRGAMFNALKSRMDIDGAFVLDCFCGTGALGLEALSRGAAHATFWDKDRRSLDLARQNAQNLGAGGAADFILQDATRIKMGREAQAYDLIFLDPPYRQNLAVQALSKLSAERFLTDGTMIVIEAEKEHDPNLLGSFRCHFDKIYSDTRVMILKYVAVDQNQ